jgi:hypothetical protein
MLHTIELLLGFPPMSQYDAAAEPMWRRFSDQAHLTPFEARPPQTDISAVNMVENAWQRKSEKFDFSREDRIPDRAFTEVIGEAVKVKIPPYPYRAGLPL